jgi:hypothetical protein
MSEDATPAGPFAFLSRRRLLAAGLGTAAVVAAGTAGLRALRGSAPDVAGLSVLSAQEYRTLASIARAQLPRGGPFDLGAADFDLPRAFDGFLAHEPEHNVRDLQRALLLVEYGPVLFGRRLATFSNLSDAEQATHWDEWRLSDSALRRQVALAFRKFLSMVFYDTPAVWPHIGYPGPVIGTTP